MRIDTEHLIRNAARPLFEPRSDCEWADLMVLNPALLALDSGHWLMLFRASGACDRLRFPGKDTPYPIFLGFAESRDGGVTWQADWSRPALAPRLALTPEELLTPAGGVNYANGCIEDPRLMQIDGECFLSVACRVFPPGAYWEVIQPDDPHPDTMPDWHRSHPDGAVRRNHTVTVLYRVDVEALKRKDYAAAFEYLGPLTDPGEDDRDAFLLPARLEIGGELCYVLFHRPGANPRRIRMAAAPDWRDFALPAGRARRWTLAEAAFDWEGERIGGSWPPAPLGGGEWFFGYHGKRDNVLGYTQSFMILAETGDGLAVKHRLPERLFFAREEWEQSRLLCCPCVFSCSGVVAGNELVMGYGAGDEKLGIARADFEQLTALVRKYDAAGKSVPLG